MNPTEYWRIDAPGSLAWREWEGEAVIHDDRTGATHFLGAAAASVWQAFQHAGRSVTPLELAAKLDFTGQAPDAATGEIVAAVIAEFERLGLIRAESA